MAKKVSDFYVYWGNKSTQFKKIHSYIRVCINMVKDVYLVAKVVIYKRPQSINFFTELHKGKITSCSFQQLFDINYFNSFIIGLVRYSSIYMQISINLHTNKSCVVIFCSNFPYMSLNCLGYINYSIIQLTIFDGYV